MKSTYLIHGFNVRDNGLSTVCRLTDHITRWSPSVVNHSYGWFGLLQALWCNRKVAKKLRLRMRTEIKKGDKAYAIGHSNGCAILLKALKQGAEFENILLINPALNIKTKFPATVKRIIVVHTDHDKAVKAAKIFDSIPIVELIVPDAWGAMGQKGYKGQDQRVTNLDMTALLDGHSALFDRDNLLHMNIIADILYCPEEVELDLFTAPFY